MLAACGAQHEDHDGEAREGRGWFENIVTGVIDKFPGGGRPTAPPTTATAPPTTTSMPSTTMPTASTDSCCDCDGGEEAYAGGNAAYTTPTPGEGPGGCSECPDGSGTTSNADILDGLDWQDVFGPSNQKDVEAALRE